LKGNLGFTGDFYARFGGGGVNFQPELYSTYTSLTIINKSAGYTNKAAFTDLTIPLLVGEKCGTEAFGERFYTGPVLLFSLIRQQNFADPNLNEARLDQ